MGLDLEDVFKPVDEHREEPIQRLAAYANLETGGSPVVLGVGPRRPGRPTVIVYGHDDVQPPDPLDAWDTPPFQPTLWDGRLYGRGTAHS